MNQSTPVFSAETPCWELLESAWRARKPGESAPRWHEFLPTVRELCGPESIVNLILVDIEFRHKAGMSFRLGEDYLDHPRLQELAPALSESQLAELQRWGQFQLRREQRPREIVCGLAANQSRDSEQH